MVVSIKSAKCEQHNKQEDSKERYQIFAVFSAALTALNTSILFNWTSPSIPILISSEEYPDIDIDLASYLSIIPLLVSIVAAPLYGYCLDRYGRKFCLLNSGILDICSWTCVIFTKSLYVLYISRVLFGISNAAMFTVLPIYISEITTPNVRGKWGNLMALFMYSGQFITNAVGYFFDIKTTACILITIPVMFVILFAFCPETPYYYISKSKNDKAEKSLQKLRRSNNVKEELFQLTVDVKRQLSESGNYIDCFKIKSNRKAIFIVGMGRGLQQFSGISAYAAYNQYIFQEAGTSLDKGYSSMIYTSSLLLVSFMTLTFVNKLNRKKSMVISTIGCFISLSAEAIYFLLKEYFMIDVSRFNWFPILGMITYVITFSSGLNLIPMLLLGELFSTSIRSKAGTIITILSSVYIASINKLFPVLTSNYGLYAPFAMFAVCTFIGIFLSYAYIPETKGKTLEEIQQMLKGNDERNKSNIS